MGVGWGGVGGRCLVFHLAELHHLEFFTRHILFAPEKDFAKLLFPQLLPEEGGLSQSLTFLELRKAILVIVLRWGLLNGGAHSRNTASCSQP